MKRLTSSMLVMAVLMVGLLGCSDPTPDIGMKIGKVNQAVVMVNEEKRSTYDDITFLFDYSSTNGLLGLHIKEDDTNVDVWHISLNYYDGENLKYGDVPKEFVTSTGVTNSAKQRFPETGKPTALVEGRLYVLISDWQYDQWATASSMSNTKYFKIEEGGVVFVKGP